LGGEKKEEERRKEKKRREGKKRREKKNCLEALRIFAKTVLDSKKASKQCYTVESYYRHQSFPAFNCDVGNMRLGSWFRRRTRTASQRRPGRTP